MVNKFELKIKVNLLMLERSLLLQASQEPAEEGAPHPGAALVGRQGHPAVRAQPPRQPGPPAPVPPAVHPPGRGAPLRRGRGPPPGKPRSPHTGRQP